MPAFTDLTVEEKKNLLTTDDEQINKLLHEVNGKILHNKKTFRYLISYWSTYKKTLFRKPIEYKHYSLYVDFDQKETQVHIITSCNNKEEIIAYFDGWLDSYNSFKKGRYNAQ